MRRKAFYVLCVALLMVLAVSGVMYAQQGAGSPSDEASEGQRAIYFPAGFSRIDGVFVAEGSETEPVRITFDDTVVYAQRLTYHEDEEWAELEGEVRVEREGMIITAAKATLSLDDEQYIFEGAVHMNDTEASTPRQIWADHVTYDGETGNLTAVGNVRMEEEKRWFTAERMEFDAENDRAVLEGNVFVNDESGTIRAQRMEIDLEEGSFSGSGPGQIVLSRRSSNEAD